MLGTQIAILIETVIEILIVLRNIVPSLALSFMNKFTTIVVRVITLEVD